MCIMTSTTFAPAENSTVVLLNGMFMHAQLHMFPEVKITYKSMRDEEGRKMEASKVKQTTRQSNTVHPRQSLS